MLPAGRASCLLAPKLLEYCSCDNYRGFLRLVRLVLFATGGRRAGIDETTRSKACTPRHATPVPSYCRMSFCSALENSVKN